MRDGESWGRDGRGRDEEEEGSSGRKRGKGVKCEGRETQGEG